MMLRKGNIFAVVVVIFLILALGGSAFAAPGSITYRKFYDLDGLILMKIQAGSDYSETGLHKTLITGAGSLQRGEYIVMDRVGITADNDSRWIADPDSQLGLEVASAFILPDLDKTGSEEENAEQALKEKPVQVFAVSVKADPGESGQLLQNISAASEVYGEKQSLFTIDQFISTSGGTVKRYIDIIEPISGEYLFEDAIIKGSAEIYDSLQLTGENPEGVEMAELPASGDGHPENSVIAEEEPVKADEMLVIMDGDDYFEMTVPLGTELHDIGLPASFDLTSDLVTIKDILIAWDGRLFDLYDPQTAGTYFFAGELIFPENISLPEKVYICYNVHVVEEESNHLEDLVHRGEDGEDEQADEEADR